MTDNARAISVPQRPEPTDPPDLTPLFARPGGSLRLRPIQSWALAEIAEVGGLVAPIGVGHGKTLIMLLAPAILELALGRPLRTLLLVPAAFRGQLEADRIRYGEHFQLPEGLTVWSYAQLSQPQSATALEELAPELLVADEAHYLRHRTATRTKRLGRYMTAARPAFVALSGTITTRSVTDYAHLLDWALGEGSPVPRQWTWLQSWAAAIDADGQPSPQDLACVGPLVDAFGPPADGATPLRERARHALRARLRSTRGIVSTHETSARGTLVLRDRQLAVPSEVSAVMAEVSATWEVPGGDCFASPAQLAAVLRQVSIGFFYRWAWPGGKVDGDWLDARAAWARGVRGVLARGRSGLDSEYLVRTATETGNPPSPGCAAAWSAWQTQREKAPPPVDTVWISDFVAQDALRWAAQGAGRIVWYAHEAMGAALEAGGLRVHGAGTEPPDDGKTCACSISVHGAMRNLQMYSAALVTAPPASGATWEQLLGRLHRAGQEADPVVFEVYQHTQPLRAALAQADRDAAYIETTQGQVQKLRLALRTHTAPVAEEQS